VAPRRPPGGRLIFAAALLCCAPLSLAHEPLPAVPGAPAALAADPGADGLCISLERFELEPVTAAELAGARALSQSSPRLKASAVGGGLRADGGLQVTPLAATIERELPALWEFRRRRGGPITSLPRVRVDVEGSLPRPIQVRASEVSRRDGGDGSEIFVGGVILVIPLEALQAHGRLSTRLRITVEGM
jgi:hypothetical protein